MAVMVIKYFKVNISTAYYILVRQLGISNNFILNDTYLSDYVYLINLHMTKIRM